MKIITSITLLANLFADDLPQKSKHAGITLFSLDIYQASRLSAKTLERLRTHLRKGDLEELRFPEKESPAITKNMTIANNIAASPSRTSLRWNAPRAKATSCWPKKAS